MSDYVGYLELGRGAGAIIAAFALGPPISQQGAGMVNLSLGAMTTWTAHLYADLRQGRVHRVSDPDEQIRDAFAKVTDVLAEAGLDDSHVVEMTSYHVGICATSTSSARSETNTSLSPTRPGLPSRTAAS